MTLLLLFNGATPTSEPIPTELIDETLADLDARSREELATAARELLASVDFGLSDEELLRNVHDAWGAQAIGGVVASMSDVISRERIIGLLPHVLDVARKASDEVRQVIPDGTPMEITADATSWCGAIMLLIGSFLTTSSVLHLAAGDMEAAAVFGLLLTLLGVMQQLWKEASRDS